MNDPVIPCPGFKDSALYASIARRLRRQGFRNATAQSVHAVHVRLILQTMREYRQIYTGRAAGDAPVDAGQESLPAAETR